MESSNSMEVLFLNLVPATTKHDKRIKRLENDHIFVTLGGVQPHEITRNNTK